MKTKISASVLLVGILLTLFSFDIPDGWFPAGDHPKSYVMDIDESSNVGKKGAMTIKSIDKEIDGFGTLMTNSKPDKLLGKRVRMTGWMKTKDVKEWAGLWFRVDGKDKEAILSFDNMKDGKTDRSIKGTTDWKKYEIILDIPPSSTQLAYGALLCGTGQIWFIDVNLEEVSILINTTGK